ncbi:hypothetical protein LIER_07200 [Lithospermum erythrorhizon]|uniref:Uncharacterized protein n=1 Tax=Lithospermum erythrorhizon TaxID=34254 RepID=A0AAV3P7D1_LITER
MVIWFSLWIRMRPLNSLRLLSRKKAQNQRNQIRQAGYEDEKLDEAKERLDEKLNNPLWKSQNKRVLKGMRRTETCKCFWIEEEEWMVEEVQLDIKMEMEIITKRRMCGLLATLQGRPNLNAIAMYS